MDPNSLSKENKNTNKSFLGALGGGGERHDVPLDPPVHVIINKYEIPMLCSALARNIIKIGIYR